MVSEHLCLHLQEDCIEFKVHYFSAKVSMCFVKLHLQTLKAVMFFLLTF